ncbi:hypothetical protein ASF10_08815 [Flavobacterium sp. Leaf82]|nr:hypothetical protein ASF10_08815 [Flavobacterium sp. Leaf82]
MLRLNQNETFIIFSFIIYELPIVWARGKYPKGRNRKWYIIKKYVDGKLESFIVEMYAMNYGNVLSFSKINDTIFIKNADEFIKNNKEIRELIYKKK